MCQFKSGIILKDEIFIPDYDSHTDMLSELGIEDIRVNAERVFVRAELIPPANDMFVDVNEWEFKVDQDIIPDWFVYEYEKQRMIEAVKTWSKTHIFIGVDGLALSEKGTYYVKNCTNVTCTNSSVEAYNNSSVVARGNSSVVARDNSSVEAWDNSSVVARGNSSVVARDNSSVEARGNSSVEAYNNSSVEAYNNSSVVAYNNSSVVAWDNSSVVAYNNSSVVAYNNSSVVARGNSSVEAWDNSSVEARGNSMIIKPVFSMFRTKNIVLSENSTFKDCVKKIIYQSGDYKLVRITDGKIKKKEGSV